MWSSSDKNKEVIDYGLKFFKELFIHHVNNKEGL